MPNSVVAAQECDARDDDSSTAAGNKIIKKEKIKIKKSGRFTLAAIKKPPVLREAFEVYNVCKLSVIAFIFSSASAFFFCSTATTSGLAFCTNFSLDSFFSTDVKKPL